MEELMQGLELLDVKPVSGQYTWYNKRKGSGHISSRLDRFLVSGHLLEDSLLTSS